MCGICDRVGVGDDCRCACHAWRPRRLDTDYGPFTGDELRRSLLIALHVPEKDVASAERSVRAFAEEGEWLLEPADESVVGDD